LKPVSRMCCRLRCHSEYPTARGALIEPRKNRGVACAVRTTDLFMSSAAKNLTVRPCVEFILSEAEGLRVTIVPVKCLFDRNLE